MPTILKALFLSAAVVCFVVAAFRREDRFRTVSLTPLGLALAVIPFAFDAWAAVDD